MLTGYLRLRSPYNLCLDAALVILASNLAQSVHQWLRIAEVRHGPVEQFSVRWSINEAVEIAVAMLYFAGIGIFLVGARGSSRTARPR